MYVEVVCATKPFPLDICWEYQAECCAMLEVLVREHHTQGWRGGVSHGATDIRADEDRAQGCGRVRVDNV